MMEGISQEACSLAGHWGLGKLIALYDDNHISIDGSTDISFTEDVSARYAALGWQVILHIMLVHHACKLYRIYPFAWPEHNLLLLWTCLYCYYCKN